MITLLRNKISNKSGKGIIERKCIINLSDIELSYKTAFYKFYLLDVRHVKRGTFLNNPLEYRANSAVNIKVYIRSIKVYE